MGRAGEQAYCYVFFRAGNLGEDARKRLAAIAEHTRLGAGFDLAMEDLAIRGAGDVLGIRQSGKASDTGLLLYFQLLEERIEALKSGKATEKRIECRIDLAIPLTLESELFSSEADRLGFFRDLEGVKNTEQLDALTEAFAKESFTDGLERLLLLVRARLGLSKFGIVLIKRVLDHFTLEFGADVPMHQVRAFLDAETTHRSVLATPRKIRMKAKVGETDEAFLRFLVETVY